MDKPYGRIYVITNSVNGKQYVGQTTMSLSARWRAHQRGDCRALVNAIRKYGLDKFEIREIETAPTLEELNAREIAWIIALSTVAPEGYNLRHGGSRGKPSEETRKRQSLAHMGKTHPPEVLEAMRLAQATRRRDEATSGSGPVFTSESREKMRLAKTGTKQSAETCAARAASLRGKKPSLVTREKLAAAARGRIVSEETRIKMREASSGKKQSLETIEKRRAALQGRSRPQEVVAKISESLKGRSHSPETRARMSAARKAYYARMKEDAALQDQIVDDVPCTRS